MFYYTGIEVLLPVQVIYLDWFMLIVPSVVEAPVLQAFTVIILAGGE